MTAVESAHIAAPRQICLRAGDRITAKRKLSRDNFCDTFATAAHRRHTDRVHMIHAANSPVPFGLANPNSLLECRTQVQAPANNSVFMFSISMPAFATIRLMKRSGFAAGATPKTEMVEE